MKASELGISHEEKCALKAVRDGLASGRYKHITATEVNGPNRSKRRAFNMSMTCEERGCGTIACIGGWVAREMGMDIYEADRYVLNAGYDLSKLYFPDTDFGWEKIKPKMAAEAIDNFLKTGDPQWDKVAA